jgi:predicted methyltransferase
MSALYPTDSQIELVNNGAETTLYIDGRQAMQAWEQELMWRSADILCSWGSEFLEVGLGLGISALRIASHSNTRRHRVVEKYQRVIDLFQQNHPSPPPTLEIVNADIFEFAYKLETESVDGIFFDPFFSTEIPYDAQELWRGVLPRLVRALRIGGAFVPYFATKPELRWPYYLFFDRVIVERHPYDAYPATEYTPQTSGDAFIQCFVRTR